MGGRRGGPAGLRPRGVTRPVEGCGWPPRGLLIQREARLPAGAGARVLREASTGACCVVLPSARAAGAIVPFAVRLHKEGSQYIQRSIVLPFVSLPYLLFAQGRLNAVMRARGVALYLNGHDHNLQVVRPQPQQRPQRQRQPAQPQKRGADAPACRGSAVANDSAGARMAPLPFQAFPLPSRLSSHNHRHLSVCASSLFLRPRSGRSRVCHLRRRVQDPSGYSGPGGRQPALPVGGPRVQARVIGALLLAPLVGCT